MAEVRLIDATAFDRDLETMESNLQGVPSRWKDRVEVVRMVRKMCCPPRQQSAQKCFDQWRTGRDSTTDILTENRYTTFGNVQPADIQSMTEQIARTICHVTVPTAVQK